jgi:hypothetical protein
VADREIADGHAGHVDLPAAAGAIALIDSVDTSPLDIHCPLHPLRC